MSKTTYAFPPLLFGAREAAYYLNISERVLSELQAKGDLTPLDGRGKRSFHRDELDRWAANRPEWVATHQPIR